jgi:hypothetical protein
MMTTEHIKFFNFFLFAALAGISVVGREADEDAMIGSFKARRTPNGKPIYTMDLLVVGSIR